MSEEYLTRIVKAKNGAVVYDIDGFRIPEDGFVTVPVSPGVLTAIKTGDLEALPVGTPAPVALHRRSRRTIEEARNGGTGG